MNPEPEAEFLEKIQTRVLTIFLLAIHSHLYTLHYSFEFEISVSSNSRNLFNVISTVKVLYTVKEKGGNLIENHTPLWLMKSQQNPQV
jgi:hypothetical protein